MVLSMWETKEIKLAYDLSKWGRLLSVAYRCTVYAQRWTSTEKLHFPTFFLTECWANQPHTSPCPTLRQWETVSFWDTLWTLELMLVTSQAIKRDLWTSGALCTLPFWTAQQPGICVPALNYKTIFINKSEPITIKLLSVFKIIIKIKEMIYSKDFKWHLLK